MENKFKHKMKIQICPSCGFRMRGKNHNEGDHHKKGKFGNYSPPTPSKR